MKWIVPKHNLYLKQEIFYLPLKFNLENVTVERLEYILKMIKRYDMTPLRYNFGLIHTEMSDLGALKHETLLQTKFNEKLSVKRESEHFFYF